MKWRDLEVVIILPVFYHGQGISTFLISSFTFVVWIVYYLSVLRTGFTGHNLQYYLLILQNNHSVVYFTLYEHKRLRGRGGRLSVTKVLFFYRFVFSTSL